MEIQFSKNHDHQKLMGANSYVLKKNPFYFDAHSMLYYCNAVNQCFRVENVWTIDICIVLKL